MLIAAALPAARFLLEVSGLPLEWTRLVSVSAFLGLLAIYLPYRMIRRSFGGYWNLWVLCFLCLLAGYETVALLRLLNHYHPMDTSFAQNSGLPYGLEQDGHPLVHFLVPAVFAPPFALLATPFYFLFRSLRRTIGGGRYTG